MACALKVLSGKYQGGELPLPAGGELLIGRAPELDLVLTEDMVSRKHAKLAVGEQGLRITDLGSTNGTFVNGEKIHQAELQIGDRILIGTSIFKVIDAAELALPDDPRSLKELLHELAQSATDATTMSGDLTEVPLPDLLQLFATNQRSGALGLDGPQRGKVYLRQGRLVYAVVGGDASQSPMKALCRMLTWESGTFHLEPIEDGLEFPETFDENTEGVLIEALRQVDEMRHLLSELPAAETRLRLCVPLTPKLTDLSRAELDTLQLALNFSTAQGVMDHTRGTDYEACSLLHKLLRLGYLEVD